MPSEQEINSLNDRPAKLVQPVDKSSHDNHDDDNSHQFNIIKSDDSSELSDIGEDQSEAETDKMDFLRPENSSNDDVSDLNTLSKLTELARLQEIDSDYEENLDNHPTNHDDDHPPNVDEPHNHESSSVTPKVNGKRAAGDESRSVSKKVKLAVDDDEPDADEESEGDSDDEGKIQGPDQDQHEPNHDKTIEPQSPKLPPDVPENDDNLDPESKPQELDSNDHHVEHDEDHKSPAGDDVHHHAEQSEDNDDHEPQADSDDDAEHHDHLNKQRQLAVDELITIEKLFVEIRDKLYQDKLKMLEQELKLCLDGSHPELTRIYFKINGFYQDSLRLANNTLNYRLKCINTETIATRTSIHQDFLRHVMDDKNDMISETTSKWYKVNKERNQMDQLVPDYAYSAIPEIRHPAPPPVPEDHINGMTAINGVHGNILNGINGHGYGHDHHYESSPNPEPMSKKAIKQSKLMELVQHRNDLNQELGILNSLIQFHGFPSSINLSNDDNSSHELLLSRANDEEIAEDLTAMGIPI